MSLNKLTLVKRRVKSAIRKAHKAGFDIHHMGTDVEANKNTGLFELTPFNQGNYCESKQVCAIAAVSIGQKGIDEYGYSCYCSAAAQNLDITAKEAREIENGFCNFDPLISNISPFYKLGITIAKELEKEGLYPVENQNRDCGYIAASDW